MSRARGAGAVALALAPALLLSALAGPPGDRPALAGSPDPARPGLADERRALRRACAWLWARQAADGGWHSESYGLLASGQALTPFVLDALLRVPEEVAPRPPGGVARGLAFLRAHVGPDGRLGCSIAGLAEYPTYATALGLSCLARAGEPADRELIARMRAALLASQLASDLPADHPAQGGWGFGVRPPGHPGHVDLGHTRHALEALARSGGVPEPARARALRFLALLQKEPGELLRQPLPGAEAARDGGFYFSPVVLPASKGRELASYATATCDGLQALLHAGVPADDPRVRAAAAWLEAQPRLDLPQGIPTGGSERWAESIVHYHLAVRAEAWALLGRPGAWRGEMRSLLAGWQREDGSFVNRDCHLMKEDDPFVATALAVLALAS